MCGTANIHPPIVVWRLVAGLVVRIALGLALGPPSLGCGDAGKGATSARLTHATQRSTAPAAAASKQAKGRWRLAPNELDKVILWASHILIRHRGVDRKAPFELPGWRALPTPPSRSRKAALDIAMELAERVRERPDRFSELARRHSEDSVTRARGGSLGGRRASQLRFYPQVLDALSSIAPGETSGVVETRHGFHVLLLRPPPSEQKVAARRIAISYDGLDAQAIGGSLAPSSPPRSRDEASALAAKVARELAADPKRFDELREMYSCLGSESGQSDLGSWSTHEPNLLPRELEALSEVAVGEVTEPLDTALGFQVLMRTSPAAIRSAYAEMLRIPFRSGDHSDMVQALGQGAEPLPLPEVRSREAARALMASVARTLADSPQLYDDFLASYCCAAVDRLVLGRGRDVAAEAGIRLAPGAIAPEPLELPGAFVLPRRLTEERAREQRVASFSLPSPEAPDVLALAATSRGPGVQNLIEAFAAHAPRALELSGERARALDRIHDDLVEGFASSVPAARRRDVIAEAQTKLRELLSAQEFEQYTHLLEGHVAVRLMR